MKKTKDSRLLTQDGKYDITNWNEIEMEYFLQIFPQEGLLYVTGRPGDAKSAILRSICKKVKVVETGEPLQEMDIRLSMVDETDVGLYPKIGKATVTVNGETYEEDVLKHVVPEWAVMANEKPTLIIFEELNRAQVAQRNAGMQIFLERQIGFKFKLNENAFMCATGNLGEDDGTEVEELDKALNNRLIHKEHNLTYQYWVDFYARENVHPIIIKFLTAHTQYFYDSAALKQEEKAAFATPRSWTHLSKFITKNFGENAPIDKWIDHLSTVGQNYIGETFITFYKYLQTITKISAKDIVDRYKEIQADESLDIYREKRSEIINDLKEIDLKILNEEQIENIKLFLLDSTKDESYTFMYHITEKYYDIDIDNDDENKSISDLTSLDKDDRRIVETFMRDERLEWFMDVAEDTMKQNEEYSKQNSKTEDTV